MQRNFCRYRNKPYSETTQMRMQFVISSLYLVYIFILDIFHQFPQHVRALIPV